MAVKDGYESFGSGGGGSSTDIRLFVQDAQPDAGDVLEGYLWSKTSATNSLQRATDSSTFVSVEGGSAAHDVLSATHGDAETASVVRGDVLIVDAAPEIVRLAVGAADRFLKSDGTDVAWGQVGHDELSDVGTDDHHTQAHDHSAAGDGQTLQPLNLDLTSPTTLTVATGDITVTQNYHLVAGQGATDDDLIGINGGSVGRMILLRPSDDTQTITVKHNSSPGAADNILLALTTDYLMADEEDTLLLVWDAALDTNGAWIEVSRGAVILHHHAGSRTGGTVAHSDTTGQGVDDHHNDLHAAAHADGQADELAVQDLASDAATDGQVAKADGAGAVAFEDDKVSVNFIIDGGGSAITTGVKGYIEIPFAMEIEGVTMLADQSGSIVVDIWKDIYANYPPLDADSITASAVPTISTAIKSQDLTLTGWTVAVVAGDILGFNVDSITTIERVTMALRGKKT